MQADALELIRLEDAPACCRNAERLEALRADELVQYVLLDAESNVLCPACKLWNTGHGANMMREAVSLMGGYGITEDCPGFLGQKWMDAQLEATYEGPEAVQRRQLSLTMNNDVFKARFRQWIRQLRRMAGDRPGTGACALASAMQLWLWTLEHLEGAKDAQGVPLYQGKRHGVVFPLADALCWLLAARQLILDVEELRTQGPSNPMLAEGLDGTLAFYTDLCHVQAARAASELSRVCAELVFGYNRHPSWDGAGCGSCWSEEELDQVEQIVPGIAAGDCDCGMVSEEGEEHPAKEGPCVRLEGMGCFIRLRSRLDGCLTGSRLAKDRAAQALTQVMIPEALDYPV